MKIARECAVREEYQVRTGCCRVVEQLEEVAAPPDRCRCPQAVAGRQAALGEHLPLSGPLLGHGGWNHHHHWPLAVGWLPEPRSQLRRHVCLAHADLVGEHETGLVGKASEYFGGGLLLAVGVGVRYAIITEALILRLSVQFTVVPPRARRERTCPVRDPGPRAVPAGDPRWR